MDDSSLRIIFMGTPEFAVPCLDILLSSSYNIVAVITSVDKYGGRGKKTLLQSPVKKYAIEKELEVLQPPNLKSKKFIAKLKSLDANLQIVVAFRMLPEVVWNMPTYGTYNLHGSLLPKYRGAAPINWAIINGESNTGVTSFKLKHEIDTGDLLLKESLPIYQTDNLENVHDRMKDVAAETVLSSVKMIEEGSLKLLKQEESEVVHAPKLYTETCKIDFKKSCVEVFNFIRGLNPYPTAWTLLDDLKLKIYHSSFELSDDDSPIGTWLTDNKSYLKCKCADGYIDIMSLQLAGKRKMNTTEFLNGYDIKG